VFFNRLSVFKYIYFWIFLFHKNETPVLCNTTPVLGVNLQRGGYVYWLFFKILDSIGYFSRPMISHQPYLSKGLGESFSLIWLNIGPS